MEFRDILRDYSRYLLILFNFLFILTGVLILSVGFTVKAYYHEYSTFLDNKFFYVSDLLIIVGVIIFAIAFFGFYGALKTNACLTLTFSTLLIVIFILEVIVGIGGFLLKNKTEEIVQKTLTDTMKQYNTNNTELTDLWDHIQTKFHCCGVNNYTDWITATNTTNNQIPITCCTFKPGTSGNVSCSLGNDEAIINKVGCLEELSDYIEGHAVTIEGVGLGLAIIQLLGVVLSCYLAKQIKNDYETV